MTFFDVPLPAVLLQNFGLIGAVEEFTLKELHSNHSKDEHEENVDNEDVEDVLQRVHNTVKHGLEQKKTDKLLKTIQCCQLAILL